MKLFGDQSKLSVRQSAQCSLKKSRSNASFIFALEAGTLYIDSKCIIVNDMQFYFLHYTYRKIRYWNSFHSYKSLEFCFWESLHNHSILSDYCSLDIKKKSFPLTLMIEILSSKSGRQLNEYVDLRVGAFSNFFQRVNNYHNAWFTTVKTLVIDLLNNYCTCVIIKQKCVVKNRVLRNRVPERQIDWHVTSGGRRDRARKLSFSVVECAKF